MSCYDIKLVDFKTTDVEITNGETAYGKCNFQFNIQIFGINEKRETFSLSINDFNPYFFVKIPTKFRWKNSDKNEFMDYIKAIIGEYYEDSIHDSVIIKKKMLYGFDGQKEHNFLLLSFKNMRCFNLSLIHI